MKPLKLLLSFLVLCSIVMSVVSVSATAPKKQAKIPVAKHPVKSDTAKSSAPAFPATDIVLCTLRDSAGTFSITGTPANISHRAGYDNQPAFLSDGNGILYSSIRRNNQSDIYLYRIDSNKTRQMTNTPESEYSPTMMVGGGRYSVVRVEKDSAQMLWRYPLNGKPPAIVDSTLRTVAYHCWLDDQTLGLVMLEKGGGTTLRIYDIATKTNGVNGSGVGRCVAKVPTDPGLSFTQKEKDTSWVYVYDYEYRKTWKLVPLFPGQEDYAWGPHRTLITGYGSKLFVCKPPEDKVWHEFADLSRFGYTNISRIAVSPKGNRIAIVVADKK